MRWSETSFESGKVGNSNHGFIIGAVALVVVVIFVVLVAASLLPNGIEAWVRLNSSLVSAERESP